ncbi:hypothetical protein [Bacteroides helcogenes]|uniref:Uncharacterized protein n=1 Tax=Bacteroides helcogenes (strain ATCC 35417 / DSM 20613 / JCM 6297 / CCUG 15421 / P 36-108) TaxID=693979 RepID=E6SNB5_BACT6|nr:hypothetical protein [Bacteroides helcogenes]ADV42708.1 hypothetical protein Bache_0685 [Bacteroides helcogenes P 36-108]MDY5239539.1 hypothetical protein [Bacteroides helcogenes]
MSTVELRADVFERLNVLMHNANDEALMQLSSYLQRLQKKLKGEEAKEDLRPYTMEELNARIDEAMAEEGGTPSAEVFTEMERKFPELRQPYSEQKISERVARLGVDLGLPADFDEKEEYRKHLEEKYGAV